MLVVHPEFIIDEKAQKKAVIVPLNEWNAILDDMEELNDIRSYDEAKADINDEIISFEQAVKEIKA
ncbi:MAG: hypothetical protein PF693_08045 [Spirochaetia bacterium]|jgi:hypothetical protein|nr:hypothetical protein [Spirochaetia bacterium]